MEEDEVVRRWRDVWWRMSGWWWWMRDEVEVEV